MKKTFSISLDIEQQPLNNNYQIYTTDTSSVTFNINVLEAGIAKAVTGMTCMLDVIKPDASTTTTSCTVSNGASGQLTVTITGASINQVGVYKALVKITDTDSSVTNTSSFNFTVVSGW